MIQPQCLWQAVKMSLKILGKDAHLKVKFYEIYSEIFKILPLQALLGISILIPNCPIKLL